MTVAAPTEVSLINFPPLVLLDRCDSCGAEAQARAVTTGGHELLFCAHHHRANAAKLTEQNIKSYGKDGKPLSGPLDFAPAASEV